MNPLRWASTEAMIAAVTADAGAQTSDGGGTAKLATESIEHFDGRVVALRGEEAMSRLYRFDVLVEAHVEVKELRAALLGEAVTLEMALPNEQVRRVHGMVAAVEVLGGHDGRALHHVQLVPKLWLATQRRDSRVFQQRNTRQIVAEVLNAHGVAHLFSLSRHYPEREYCVQYEETDFEFVERLLAEEGIFFYFEQPGSAAEVREQLLTALPAAAAEEAAMLARRPDASVGDGLDAAMRLGTMDTLMQMLDLAGPSEILVIGDTVASYSPLALERLRLGASDTGGALDVDESALQRFGLRNLITPTRATVRAYDYERAGRPSAGSAGASLLRDAATMAGSSESHAAHGVTTATHAVMPPETALGRAAVTLAAGAAQRLIPGDAAGALVGAAGDEAVGMVGGSEEALEMYEHHADYEEPEAALATAVSRLEQHRADHIRGSAASRCRRLMPGKTFQLDGHGVAALNERYVIVAVTHELYVGDTQAPVYGNTLECVPESVPARPPRPHKKMLQVVETGVVVGHADAEIRTQHHGCVKVQFHWDRLGEHDDRSSCWMRVMQPWSGGGYGFQFVPRIGTEVLVSFIGGDADRPVVTGCLPNLANALPHALPEHQTRSAIRTRSTPNSEGYNELMFEDRAGHEQIHLRAERDLVEEIRHDHDTTVGRHHQLTVEGDQQWQVHGTRTTAIGGDALSDVSGNLREQVRGRASRVVEGSAHREVGGTSSEASRGDTVRRVGGTFVVSADEDINLRAGDSYSLSVGSPEDPESGANIQAAGHLSLGAGHEIVLHAGAALTLRCGQSSIRLGPDTIELHAPTVRVTAEETCVVGRNGGAAWTLTDDAELVAESATLLSNGAILKLDAEARLGGDQVHLGSGDSAGSDSQESKQETKRCEVKLSHRGHQPLADCRYVLAMGGRQIRGTTDGEGWLREDVPATATSGHITVWTDDYPNGPRMSLPVSLAEPDDASTLAGARHRLRNLGYAPGGEDGDEDALDPATRRALRAFQRAHDLPPSGELDIDTISALRDAHHS